MDWLSLVLDIAAMITLLRYQTRIIPVIPACSAAGLVSRQLL